MRTLDDFKKQYCTGEFSSLFVEFNHHSASYVKLGDQHFDLDQLLQDVEFPSAEEKTKALEANSIWTIQWYPDTPISSYHVGASTFEIALEYAFEVAKKTSR